MNRFRTQRGQSLIETVVAVAIATTALAAVGAGVIAAERHFGPDARQTALEAAANRELRVAIDIVKYQGGSIAPTTVATSVPLGPSSMLPAQMSVSTNVMPGGGVAVTITAASQSDATKTATVTATVSAPAPLPSAQIDAPGAAPAPTGAP